MSLERAPCILHLYTAEMRDYLEVHCTYNLLSNCSYKTIISRVTVVMGLLIRL